jgi:hypothetical protein
VSDARLTAGLVVQPLVAAVVAFLAFPFVLLDGSGRDIAGGYPNNAHEAALSVALGSGFVALVMTMVFVWPTAALLTRRRQLTLGDALLFGLAFGNLAYLLLAIVTGGRIPGVAVLVRGMAFSTLLGLAGAAAFWALALRPTASSPPDHKPGR